MKTNQYKLIAKHYMIFKFVTTKESVFFHQSFFNSLNKKKWTTKDLLKAFWLLPLV